MEDTYDIKDVTDMSLMPDGGGVSSTKIEVVKVKKERTN